MMMLDYDTGQRNQTINGLLFQLNCHYFPEQYDILDKNNLLIACLSLRDGDLTLYNHNMNEIWWETDINDLSFPEHQRLNSLNWFSHDDERTFFLNVVAKIINEKM